MDSNTHRSLPPIDENSQGVTRLTRPSEWLDAYNTLLDKYPLRTKMMTSAVVSAFGSALGSYLSSKKKGDKSSQNANGKAGSILGKMNWVDVLSYAIHGGLINAPLSHYWFEWLTVNGPSSNTASVLIDQLVVQPPLLVLMFVCLDLCRANIRCTINQIREARVVSNALSNVGPTVVASWRFWPFAVYLTFKYLKKKHYTVALNLCSVAWTVYLSRDS